MLATEVSSYQASSLFLSFSMWKKREKSGTAWWKVHGTVSKGIIFLLLRDLFHEDLPDFFLRTSASKEEISGYNHKTKTQRPK